MPALVLRTYMGAYVIRHCMQHIYSDLRELPLPYDTPNDAVVSQQLVKAAIRYTGSQILPT